MDDNERPVTSRRKMPFHEQWQRKHEVWDFDGWSDDGFDPSMSRWPRDVQIFAAMGYGKSDIENGGFHQFFGNSTGAFAPEMVEFCNRAGLDDVAATITEAMKMLGSPYPVDRASRQAALADITYRGVGGGSDPFHDLNERFFNQISRNRPRYDDAADAWLRNVCGIKSIDDIPNGG